MFRIASLLLTASLISGCATNRDQQPPPMSPPPGWQGTPAMVAPAPSGCSSCGNQAPVVAAPRYTPPMPASPPLTSNISTQPTLVAIGSPVAIPKQPGPLQIAFKPSIPPIESARIGSVQVEQDETTAIPVPPAEVH